MGDKQRIAGTGFFEEEEPGRGTVRVPATPEVGDCGSFQRLPVTTGNTAALLCMGKQGEAGKNE